ncbi:MAG: transposase [Acidobacteria bacterium]|jgi:putative transposase|nr:transposase [Bryobacteraceae bacterium CoA2 C42]
MKAAFGSSCPFEVLLTDDTSRLHRNLGESMQFIAEMKYRGIRVIAVSQGIDTVFPETQVQLCIVHQVRASLNYVSWKQRKEVAADLRLIYCASTAEDAERRLDEFAAKWDGSYPTISPSALTKS